LFKSGSLHNFGLENYLVRFTTRGKRGRIEDLRRKEEKLGGLK
jgi:hypothetical protein